MKIYGYPRICPIVPIEIDDFIFELSLLELCMLCDFFLECRDEIKQASEGVDYEQDIHRIMARRKEHSVH